MGVRCLVDQILAPIPAQDALPPGALMLFDTTLEHRDLVLPSELGDRIVLFYLDAAELEATA